jgi:hypothetical protein
MSRVRSYLLSKLYFDVAVHDLSRHLAERSIVTAHSHCYRFTRVDTLTMPAA